jgi:hypothetical protein
VASFRVALNPSIKIDRTPAYLGAVEFKANDYRGIGVFYNGEVGFNATAGYGIIEDLKIQASAFLSMI